MRHGFEKENAFRIMETVRRGDASMFSDGDIAEMKEKGISDEYIGSMMKIRYIFPRAHHTKYAVKLFGLIRYKLYHPKEFASALAEYSDALASAKGE